MLVLHNEMENKIGHKLDLPNLLAEPVMVALVGETEGKISHGLFVEAVGDLCAIGSSPLSARQIRTGPVEIGGRKFDTAEQALLGVMSGYRLRQVRSFVPSVALEKKDDRNSPIQRTLERMGMMEDDSSLKVFYRWLPRSA